MNILLSTAYFAPVQFYTKFLLYEKVFIEQYENFIKQTYRNRCTILAANGPVDLILPVVKGRGPKILIKDLLISYDTDWQRNHWRTIFSAYGSSPFFEYYADDIRPFFESKPKFLLDLNYRIHETICELLETSGTTVFTEDFEKIPSETVNFRMGISPKLKTPADPRFQRTEYTQVFSAKFGFVPNLSILDLIFNMGPESYTVLDRSSIR